MNKTTHYEYLELPNFASADQIKKAYYRLAKRHHPDGKSGKGADHDKFLKIQEAYQVLTDPQRRKDYDNKLGDRILGEPAKRKKMPARPRRKKSTGDNVEQNIPVPLSLMIKAVFIGLCYTFSTVFFIIPDGFSISDYGPVPFPSPPALFFIVLMTVLFAIAGCRLAYRSYSLYSIPATLALIAVIAFILAFLHDTLIFVFSSEDVFPWVKDVAGLFYVIYLHTPMIVGGAVGYLARKKEKESGPRGV